MIDTPHQENNPSEEQRQLWKAEEEWDRLVEYLIQRYQKEHPNVPNAPEKFKTLGERLFEKGTKRIAEERHVSTGTVINHVNLIKAWLRQQQQAGEINLSKTLSDLLQPPHKEPAPLNFLDDLRARIDQQLTVADIFHTPQDIDLIVNKTMNTTKGLRPSKQRGMAKLITFRMIQDRNRAARGEIKTLKKERIQGETKQEQEQTQRDLERKIAIAKQELLAHLAVIKETYGSNPPNRGGLYPQHVEMLIAFLCDNVSREELKKRYQIPEDDNFFQRIHRAKKLVEKSASDSLKDFLTYPADQIRLRKN